MVEVKLCVGKLDGTTEYRRIAIPVLTQSTDVLSILRAKLSQLFPELTSDCNGIDVEFQYEGGRTERERDVQRTTCACLDDVRGLVLVDSSDGINEAARDQASRQQLLRVFVRFLHEGAMPTKYLPPKHVGVICDGSFVCSSFAHRSVCSCE
jgi:hypothetical protein